MRVVVGGGAAELHVGREAVLALALGALLAVRVAVDVGLRSKTGTCSVSHFGKNELNCRVKRKVSKGMQLKRR